MPKQDKETVRRLLESALNKLDGESRGSEESPNSILFSESDDAGMPVILVLIGGLNSSKQNRTVPLTTVDHTPASARPSAPDQDKTLPPHPGLERFPLSVTDPSPAAPKACLIEPGRACVSSGACEMRGF
jgi:hypothetical protein